VKTRTSRWHLPSTTTVVGSDQGRLAAVWGWPRTSFSPLEQIVLSEEHVRLDTDLPERHDCPEPRSSVASCH
jgi:hypothetical protein